MNEVSGTELARGKTKSVVATRYPHIVELVSHDDITAQDGAKHDVIEGKAALSTRTTVNIFKLLHAAGLPLAFLAPKSETSFTALKCKMIPLEVVVRRKAFGSKLKRDPHLSKGHLFALPLVEMYLKTTGKKWKNVDLPCDDPFLMVYAKNGVLFLPDQPLAAETRILVRPMTSFLDPRSEAVIDRMADIAAKALTVLTEAFGGIGYDFVDFKIEFGWEPDGSLVIADVIDADSGRVIRPDGGHADKQNYREGETLEAVKAGFTEIATITDSFLARTRTILDTVTLQKDCFTAGYRPTAR